jgi:pimeloyl-ACP methyl ester carboxylesterase
VLVFHDVGDPSGGADWKAAFTEAGWPGPVHVPDLPGHGDAPRQLGGNYQLADAIFSQLELLRELAEGEPPVVVGVGINGWSAAMVALAGRAHSLALVDGLGGPWLDAIGIIDAERDLMRRMAADPAALDAPPPKGLDPRLLHGVVGQHKRSMVERILAAMPVPLTVIESPASPLDDADRDALLAQCGAPVELVCVDAVVRADVAALLI